jgi:hypothetical protein
MVGINAAPPQIVELGEIWWQIVSKDVSQQVKWVNEKF